jgi:trk system potassium uptake protein TrkA
MSHQYVVVGLGLFGFSMVENLLQMGHEVLAVDTDGKRIQQLEEEGLDAQSITADPTEGNVLYELGVEDFDGAVVATGDLMANVFVTLILKDLGVPLVMAHADTKEHIRVLEQVGADSVVQPEKEFGAVASRRLVYPGTLTTWSLGMEKR